MRIVVLSCLAAALVLTSARNPTGDTVQVSSADELVRALRAPGSNLVVQLAPGSYELTPTAAIDSSCGTCEKPDTLIPITVGLAISGRGVRIVGPKDGVATIVTHAGYGIYFDDCVDCLIERVSITGGERGTSEAATDAAIVTKHSLLTIRDCVIADNAGMGVCAREGSVLVLERNEIMRCTSGIALYRATDTTIRNNLIDGDNLGVGVAGKVRATIERNHVRGCADGIRIGPDADVVVHANIVEEVKGCGIAVRGGNSGRPRVAVEENAVYSCGGPGISIQRRTPYAASEPRGKLVRNIVVHVEPGRALDLAAVPDGFAVTGNVFYDNRDAGDSSGNLSREMFSRKRLSWTRTYRNTAVGVDGRHRFYESAFLTRYGRWFD